MLQEIAKKSSLSATALWTRGPVKILNGIRLILDDQTRGITWTRMQSVWNPSGPSEVPYSINHGQELFFAISYSNLVPVNFLGK